LRLNPLEWWAGMEYLRFQALIMTCIGVFSILSYVGLKVEGFIGRAMIIVGLASIFIVIAVFRMKYPSPESEIDERTRFIEDKACKEALLISVISLFVSYWVSLWFRIGSTNILLANLLVILFSLAGLFFYYTEIY